MGSDWPEPSTVPYQPSTVSIDIRFLAVATGKVRCDWVQTAGLNPLGDPPSLC